MDVTATFRGICKARKSLTKQSGTGNQMRKPPISKFQKNAVEIVSHISKLRDHILKYRKDYLDSNSVLPESKRNELDNEAYQQIASCTELLKLLQNQVHDSKNQIKAHRTEVLLVLNLYLANVSKILAEQQAIRVRKALEKKKLSKLESVGVVRKRNLETAKLPSDSPAESPQPARKKNGSLPNTVLQDEEFKRSVSVAKDVFSTEEMQMFEHENMDLYEELAGMEDDVRLIETQMSEISKMNKIITENVMIQDHQIDYVSTAAVAATENIQAGNIDIREAIQKTASFRAWILFVVLVLSFTLLFLDWYND